MTTASANPEVIPPPHASARWGQLVRLPAYARYHHHDQMTRVASLLDLLPRDRATVLDVGARDGFLSAILTDFFASVTALDLIRPTFDFPRVVTVQGDARKLEFRDRAFDVVFCAEVLEHIPDLELACRELARVARHELVVGVPHEQDTRVGRTTCDHCGARNPPYGHVNRFTVDRLRSLFSSLRLVRHDLVGEGWGGTNPFSTVVRDLVGNPDGTYDQEEPCIACGRRMTAPPRTARRRTGAFVAGVMDRLQRPFVSTGAAWVHLLFERHD